MMVCMTTPTTPTEVILVARGEPAQQSREQLRWIRDAVTDANVLLVAPALPVPGERWIVDLDARESQARLRVERWLAALADRASVIEAEIGDADPRAAVADARRLLPSAQIVDAPAERERTVEAGA
jgi:hypothetical protein